MDRGGPGQAESSVAQNSEFFAGDVYGKHAAELDTHNLIRRAVGAELSGVERLLDVGNGGVFHYDTSIVGSIVAVDLFLDPATGGFPANVTAKRGDALALEEPREAYDAVLEAFLYHHLVGERPVDSLANTRVAIAEAARVLRPGGRLIVAESCVPRWFYGVERVMFRPVRALAGTRLLGGHPVTLQLTLDTLVAIVAEKLTVERVYPIPQGRWITQFGRRWPTWLTPARPYVIVAAKPKG